jgi:hypothetical protein
VYDTSDGSMRTDIVRARASFHLFIIVYLQTSTGHGLCLCVLVWFEHLCATHSHEYVSLYVCLMIVVEHNGCVYAHGIGLEWLSSVLPCYMYGLM